MKTFYAVIFTLVVGSGLNSCFVKGSDDSTFIALNTAPGEVQLPRYKAGDFLEYAFYGQRTIDNVTDPNVSGTLRVEWFFASNLIPPLPVGGAQRAVLKEISTLTFDDIVGSFNSVRFISQDATGNMFLHAVNGGPLSDPFAGDELFWINSDITSTVPSATPSNIFESPIDVNNLSLRQIKYDLLKGCTDLSCTNKKLTEVTEGFTYNGINTEGVSTIFGKFETLRVNYTSLNILPTPQDTPDNITVQDIDIRASCSTDFASGYGERQIHPAIGIVYMFVSCNTTNPADMSYSLNMELSGHSPNFVIPAGT